MLGRPTAAESIQECLADAMFDVEGQKLGTLTLASIRGFTMRAVSSDIAEAVRIAKASDNKEPNTGAYEISKYVTVCSVVFMCVSLLPPR
jgi:hypothetical protein